MEILHLIGRLIVGGFFIFNGLQHFMNLGMMKGYAGSEGVPAPGLAVPATGSMLVLGGLSVLLGLWPEAGLALIILFLVPVAFMMLVGAGAWPYTLGG